MKSRSIRFVPQLAMIQLVTVLLGALLSPAAATAALAHPIVFVTQTPLDYQFATVSDIFGNFEGYYPPEDQPVGGHLTARAGPTAMRICPPPRSR